ncbi:MAG: DUF2628 domain-containing protein [Candidatus Adiutrix sp.]|jgi:hypothetical protein|nr:DUF2628 domain-containing protein [Candidatus Adiutrix sp.]
MTDPTDRPPETAPVPPATTLAEARAAVVGNRYLLFEESFSLFDAKGFRLTFTWPPLFIGPLWFIYRRMYLEGFLAWVFLTGLRGAIGFDREALGLAVVASFSLALSLTGRWFYWKAVDRRLEQAMRRYPHDPDRALAWMKLKGGADLLTVMVLLFIVFLVVGSMTVAQLGLRP